MKYKIGIFLLSLLVSTTVMAGNLPSVPNTFTSGTGASASEVNANFEALRAEVDDNANDVSTNITDITALQALVTALETRLTGLSRIALIAADSQASMGKVAVKIQADKFRRVTLINAEITTPTLQELLNYDAVLVWSNRSFQNNIVLGNNMADYVDQGGGVVLATFALSGGGLSLQGRFATDNYYVVTPTPQTSGIQQQLVATIPDHTLLTSVNSFDGGTSSFHSNTASVEAGATIVATWTGGNVLVAEKEFAGTRRVDLNFYPPSSDSHGGSWDATTDGTVLMTNALLYVMGAL